LIRSWYSMAFRRTRTLRHVCAPSGELDLGTNRGHVEQLSYRELDPCPTHAKRLIDPFRLNADRGPSAGRQSAVAQSPGRNHPPQGLHRALRACSSLVQPQPRRCRLKRPRCLLFSLGHEDRVAYAFSLQNGNTGIRPQNTTRCRNMSQVIVNVLLCPEVQRPDARRKQVVG
jgi:hypothetical protein